MHHIAILGQRLWSRFWHKALAQVNFIFVAFFSFLQCSYTSDNSTTVADALKGGCDLNCGHFYSTNMMVAWQCTCAFLSNSLFLSFSLL